MSYDSKNKQANKKEDNISFWDRFYHGKGSVAEPWPTVQEVLSKKEVQEEIKKVENAFKVIDHKE